MQTRLSSFIEQLFNVGSGFLVSLIVWEYFIKSALENGTLTIDNSIEITLIFTIISVFRGYLWRRLFNNVRSL